MRRLFGAAAIAAGLIASFASAQPGGIGTSPQGTLTYALGFVVAAALLTWRWRKRATTATI